MANNLLADMKIYNCNRSPNASVVLRPIVNISVLEKDNLKKLEEALHKYVKDNPRRWMGLLIVCVTAIDTDNEQVFLQIALRHHDSWQITSRIYLHRAELMKHLFHVQKRLGITFEIPPPRRVLYMGGSLEQGAVAGGNDVDHRTDLLRPQNVRSADRSASASFLPQSAM